MNREIFQTLFLNVALLLAMTQVLAISARGIGLEKRLAWKLLAGVLIGTIGIGVMSFALVYRPGLVFDVRSVLLSMSGLFFGFLPTAIAMTMTALFRVYEGGVGMVGGVWVILTSGLLGIAWRAHARQRLADIDWRELYALGLIVHLVMLGVLASVLPGDLGEQALRNIGVPVLLMYPLAGIALGLLLRLRLRQEADANALRASEARYRSLFENKHSVMFLIDPSSGEIVDANPAAEAYYGWTRAQLRAMKIFQINPMSEADLAAEMQLARAEKRGYFNFQHRRADGSVRDVEVSSGPIKLEGRELLYSIVNDVTARRQAEAQLRETRDKLEFALRSSRVAHWEINILDESIERSFDHDQIFGYGSNQPSWTRKTFMSHVVEEDRPDAESIFRRAVRDGTDFTHECRIRRVDGAVRWLWLAGTHLESVEGQPPRMAGVVQDVTERREHEEELAQHRDHLEELVEQRTEELATARHQAESASRAKSAFLANTSHEIRTPLNAIIGLTYLLRQREPQAESREKLEKIEHAGRHLLSIVNDVLDLSKIEAGRMDLVSERFNLATILDNVASIVRAEASEKGLAMHLDYDHVPMWLEGDPTRLRQALLNYAANAVKFTESGEIHLRARLLEREGPELKVLFEVEDTGVGIPPDKLQQLFGSFEQADSSISRRFGGTGLGLAITRHLAELMGGKAGVESVEGQGSRFWFWVMLRDSAAGFADAVAEMPAAEAETFLRRRFTGKRVLMADDNAVNREITTQLLENVGLAVDAAEDGAAAVELAGRHLYDMILMDVQMPRMDGLEATRLLRARPDYAQRPILAVTANAFDADREACREAGMNDVITKPVTPDLLYEKLLKWFSVSPSQDDLVIAAPGPDPTAPGDSAGMAAAARDETPAEETTETGQDEARAHAVIARLSVTPGLQVERLIGIFSKNPQKYLDIFVDMLDIAEDDVRKTDDALHAEDWETAAGLAHRTKGAAANLGAERLRRTSMELEALCKRMAGEGADAGASTAAAAELALMRTIIADLRALLQMD